MQPMLGLQNVTVDQYQYPLRCQPPPFVPDPMCFYRNIRSEPKPLDLSQVHSLMAVAGDCKRPDNMPQSCSSGSSAVSPLINSNINKSGYSPRDAKMSLNDKVLLSISVNELYKRMEGCPREELMRFKERRRKLKLIEYGKKFKSRRLKRQLDLEIACRTLQEEIDRTKIDLARVIQERDNLKQSMDVNGPTPPQSQMPNLDDSNNEMRANFYL